MECMVEATEEMEEMEEVEAMEEMGETEGTGETEDMEEGMGEVEEMEDTLEMVAMDDYKDSTEPVLDWVVWKLHLLLSAQPNWQSQIKI